MNPVISSPASLADLAPDMRAGQRSTAARRALDAAQAQPAAQRESAMRKASEEFEAVFLSQMLAPMFAGIKTDGPFGGGHAEEIFRSMLVEETGKTIARAGGIGLADAVYRQLLIYQEA